MPCKIQYRYAHLLRDVKDLEKDFPENVEVKSFVEALDIMKVILSTIMICALHNRKSNPYLKGMTYDNSIKKTEMVQHNPTHPR
jgi:hypothetical protein